MNVQSIANTSVLRSNAQAKRQNGETTFKSAKSAEIKNTGLSKAKKAAAGIGVLGAAAGIIYLAVSGKGKKALDAVKKYFSKNADNAKEVVEDTFETSKNNKIFEQGLGQNKKIVENVKLENGRAVREDGSGFTGVMTTVNKRGDDILIQYNHGDMYRSIVNDSVLKEYKTTYKLKEIAVDGQTKTVPVKESTRIDVFRNSNPVRSTINYYEDGKLVVQSGKKTFFNYDENGKFVGMEELK